MKQRMSSLLCTLTLFSLLTPTSFGQNSEDKWRQNVDLQLAIVSRTVSQKGYQKAETYVDSIPQGSQQYIDVTLAADTHYAFIGVCDQDCSDLDLYLRDDQGNLVDSDTAPDATPVVQVTPRYTGAFRLYVSMSRCSNAPCRWGVGIYR